MLSTPVALLTPLLYPDGAADLASRACKPASCASKPCSKEILAVVGNSYVGIYMRGRLSGSVVAAALASIISRATSLATSMALAQDPPGLGAVVAVDGRWCVVAGLLVRSGRPRCSVLLGHRAFVFKAAHWT